MSSFRTRAFTALIFVIIMLGGILWNAYSFFLLFFLINYFTLNEYVKLVKRIDFQYRISATHNILITLISSFGLFAFTGPHFLIGYTSLSYLTEWPALICLIALVFYELIAHKKNGASNLQYSLLGLLYTTLPWGLLINIRLEKAGKHFPLLPLALILLIWINDTMAYIVGSWIGKTKFFPAISPKKTWEGTVGGIILTMIVAAAWGFWSNKYHVIDWIVLGAIMSCIGTMGDLLESKLKRLAGVKDSGSIMPGHGGFLDRFDSLLLSIPFAWLYIMLVMR